MPFTQLGSNSRTPQLPKLSLSLQPSLSQSFQSIKSSAAMAWPSRFCPPKSFKGLFRASIWVFSMPTTLEIPQTICLRIIW
ncbi:hypothetical protein ACSBR2_017393 [Camellia fascicularis]